MKDLNRTDQSRLNTYLDNVREIERRIERIEAYNRSGAERAVPDAPVGVPDYWEDHVKIMMDLTALAFSSEVTRVSSIKLGRDTSDRVFPESGSTKSFHSASHHGETPSGIEEFSKINRYHVSMLAYFAHKLKSMPDGDGNLLDNSLILYGSGMGNSNVHGHRRVPFLLTGHAAGTVQGNMHVRAKEETPQGNGLLSVMHKLGVEVDSVGDSTGTLAI